MQLYLVLSLAGLILFLMGLRLMSAALVKIAGGRLQTWLLNITKTPLRGTLAGTLFTMIIQSSSATTVIVVAAVNAGLLTLKQALSLIAGANVGTTITEQIVVLELYQLVLPSLSLGFLLVLWPKARQAGLALVGLGLLFQGLQLMSEHLAQLLHLPVVRSLLAACSGSPYLSIVVGMALTAIVQSSSAVTALTIALAAGRALDLSTAIGIALGSNIGTCVTALIAAHGTNRFARQAAMAHLLFNVLGVLAVIPFYTAFVDLVASTAPDLGRQIANGHTLFNLISVGVFLPIITPVSRILERAA
ncbi:MAG TPA: Na/Pi cotransporter family protein [Firmicutes bacterium]|nr:Na/Pi cotransporter family protein [Bacillota bacterium]